MQYFVHYLSPGSAETDNRWSKKLNNHLMASYIQEYSYQNLLKLELF